MTNKLKEEIERIITWRERLVLDDNDSAYRRLLDIANAEKEAIRELSTLINQKEKELLEKFDKVIGEYESETDENCEWGYDFQAGVKNQLRFELRGRIKQLKEELNKEDK